MIDITLSYETLHYKWPVPVRGTPVNENNFLKVTLLDSDYFISVLPGFHEATLEEITFKLRYFFSTYSLDFGHIDFSKKFFNLVEIDDYLEGIHSETLFNIEVLLLGMIRKTHSGLFNNNPVMENELYRAARGTQAYTQSKCLKIKIAPDSLEKTIKLINELHRLNKELIIRLDGNRQFEINEMIVFEERLKKNILLESFKKIDYIEEPFKNFADTFLFKKRSVLKVAMDESFSTYRQLSAEEFPDEIPVVIKPSLFGISSIHNWMQTHSKKRVIVSGSFEHPTVKIGLTFLASTRPYEYHGLENFL
ncbi:MAG: hypothetical protein H7336_13200 [Bacteriovorax sp.]|nr:hypothetical protein [Bacteriovorax sp.]